MQHYREIDILRGFAIVLVILGHAIIVYPVNLMNVVLVLKYILKKLLINGTIEENGTIILDEPEM